MALEDRIRGQFPSMGNHVFICYAREDEQFVFTLATCLKDRGVPVWLDQWDIPIGANWTRSIDRAIYDCTAFLIILSQDAVDSDDVQGEWLTALDERKPIVPVLHQNCRMPPRLRVFQRVDFTSRRPDDEATLAKLLRVLQTAESEAQQEENRQEEKLQPKQSEQASEITRQDRQEAQQSAGSDQYKSLPYGEPEWITIPAGEFWMGSERGADNEKPVHQRVGAKRHVSGRDFPHWYLTIWLSGHEW
jgi:TIR domain-containing protein